MLHLLALAPLLHVLHATGDEPVWGGFRGRNGSGVSAESAELPDALDPDENIIWRTEIPGGYSSPSVANGLIFLTAADGRALATLCLDAADGSVRWRADVPFDGKRPGMSSPAAPSPATDGERVYALFHHAGLIAYDLEGKELWRQPLGPFAIPHGMASSPVLCDGLVVVQADQNQDSYLAAFDARTGEERWRVPRHGTTQSYSTPAIWRPAQGPPQIVCSGSFKIAGYSLRDGAELWWITGAGWMTKGVPVLDGALCYASAFMAAPNEFGMPRMSGSFADVLAEHDADKDGKIGRSEWDDPGLQMGWFLFDLDRNDQLEEADWDYAVACSSTAGACFAIQLGGKGDVTETHVRWRYDDRRGLPDSTSPLLVDGTLFLLKEGGLLTSLDAATGKVVKQERVGEPDDYYASPVTADGKLYTAARSGQLCVVTAEADWRLLSAHTLDEEIWSTPAIVDGRIFVRTQDAVYCFAKTSGG